MCPVASELPAPPGARRLGGEYPAAVAISCARAGEGQLAQGPRWERAGARAVSLMSGLDSGLPAAGSGARATSIEGSSRATSMRSAAAVSSTVAYCSQSSTWAMASLPDVRADVWGSLSDEAFTSAMLPAATSVTAVSEHDRSLVLTAADTLRVAQPARSRNSRPT